VTRRFADKFNSWHGTLRRNTRAAGSIEELRSEGACKSVFDAVLAVADASVDEERAGCARRQLRQSLQAVDFAPKL